MHFGEKFLGSSRSLRGVPPGSLVAHFDGSLPNCAAAFLENNPVQPGSSIYDVLFFVPFCFGAVFVWRFVWFCFVLFLRSGFVFLQGI